MSNSANILLGKSVTSFKENIPHFLLTPSVSIPCSSCKLPLVWHSCWEHTDQQWFTIRMLSFFGLPLLHYVSWDDGKFCN